MTMMEEKIDDATMSAEEQLQLLLREAGLESVPMDPASMEALKALVSTPDFYHAPPPVTTEATTSASESDQHRRPVSEVVPRNPELKRFTSELTTASNDFSLFGGDNTSGMAVARSSNATGGFAPLEGASAVENHILEQLHRQTNLMLEMQRRMDDLATTVEFLMANGDGAASPIGGGGGATNTTRTPTDPATPGKRRFINTLNPPQATPAAPVAAGQPQPPVVPAAAAGRPRVAVPNNNNNNNQGGFLHAIRNARLVQIAAAFLQLRRRYGVLPLDGGLIFKVLFMMAILSTRMSGSSPSKRFATKSGVVVDDTHLKFLVMSLLVMVGFLMQTGYLKYSYIFFVKENIAGRIWDGETIEDILRGGNNNNNNNNDPNNNIANNNNPAGGQGVPPHGQLPPGHPQRGAAADHQGRANNGVVENVAVGGWRNTFLGGIIPQADQGGIVGFFQDIALVLGSFLLSIFPMWQPEAPPPPRNPQPAAVAAAQQQEQEPQPPLGGLAAGPGEVLPPRDAFQAADESDDEDA